MYNRVGKALFLCSLIVFSLPLSGISHQKSQQQNPQNSNPCGRRIDPSYIEVSEATGGQVLMLDPNEISKTGSFIIANQTHSQTILRVGGEMVGAKDFTFPVDASVKSLCISSFIQCLNNIIITRPDGSLITNNEENINNQSFKAGRVTTITNPVVGQWRIQVSGTGIFSVSCRAESKLTLDRFKFVELGGRPGHEEYFPAKNQDPKPGAKQIISMELSGQIISKEFQLVSSKGELLQKVKIKDSNVEQNSTFFLAEIIAPSQAFRIKVIGQDSAGKEFQRFYAPLLSSRQNSGQTEQ